MEVVDLSARPDTAPRTVVVPREPGPLRELSPSPVVRRDEFDELFDELFGTDDARPGWFDVTAILVGIGLIGWSLLAATPGWVRPVGSVAVVLGAILPVRAAVRWVRAALHRNRRRRALQDGVPLRVSDPDVARLVAVHDSILRGVDGDVTHAAVAAAHLALVECATALEGRPVTSPTQRSYVIERVSALGRLEAAVNGGPGRATDGRRDARIEALRDLDDLDGSSSLRHIQEAIDDL